MKLDIHNPIDGHWATVESTPGNHVHISIVAGGVVYKMNPMPQAHAQALAQALCRVSGLPETESTVCIITSLLTCALCGLVCGGVIGAVAW